MTDDMMNLRALVEKRARRFMNWWCHLALIATKGTDLAQNLDACLLGKKQQNHSMCSSCSSANFASSLTLFCMLFSGQPEFAHALDLDATLRYGFTIKTHKQDPALAADELYILYSGPVAFPLAENLQEIWQQAKNSITRVTLEIESSGGDVGVAREVVDLLREIRSTATLITRVEAGKTCASACLAIYMQGMVRQASGASAFTFHGACPPYTNIPKQEATEGFIEMLMEAGMSEKFLVYLSSCGYLTMPGTYWISGYELFHVAEANIITELLPAWNPALPITPPFDPLLRPR